ncbi:hypothetical protein JXA12_05465 [Candidatus Woesearchaeota archaeon]|nr:hypothetical protein [Candidatus Woesearchaeota archaeon]
MIIIKYGGSILNPDGKYDQAAIDRLTTLIKQHPDEQFCFIIGGGKVCRQLQEAAEATFAPMLPADQLHNARDEIGIAVTKINARYVLEKLKPILKEQLCPQLIIDPHAKQPAGFRVYLATGALPGSSTDYDMMLLAKSFNADRAIKISDFPVVLDVQATAFDKELLSGYEPLPEMTWNKLHSLVGDDWRSGGNYPLDPAACRIGQELAYKGFTLLIGQYEQLEKMVAGQEFLGTVVHGR